MHVSEIVHPMLLLLPLLLLLLPLLLLLLLLCQVVRTSTAATGSTSLMRAWTTKTTSEGGVMVVYVLTGELQPGDAKWSAASSGSWVARCVCAGGGGVML
jgi:hypothetical protein